MTDLDFAVMVLKLANDVDGGSCPPCRSAMFRHARQLRPDLPWRMAAKGLNEAHDDEYEWALEDLDASLPA